MKRSATQINLGLNLRRLRDASKLSQAAVAKGAGISLRNYAGIELSERSTNLKIIDKLAIFFKVPASDLLK